LATPEVLQKNVATVAKTDRIAILVRCGAQLHEGHFFGRIDTQLLLQVLGDIW
jgi:hypothetical protein